MSSIPPPPPPPDSKGSKNKIVLAGIAAVIVVSVLVLVFLFMFQSGMVGNPFGPQPEVILVSGHIGAQGLNYVYYVDANVRNNGNAGYVTVYAEINGAGRTEQQDQRVYVGTEDSRSLTFTFDISLWGSPTDASITYKAWATAS